MDLANLDEAGACAPRSVCSEYHRIEPLAERETQAVRQRQAFLGPPAVGCPLSVSQGDRLNPQLVAHEQGAGFVPSATGRHHLLRCLAPVCSTASGTAEEGLLDHAGTGLALQPGEQRRSIQDCGHPASSRADSTRRSLSNSPRRSVPRRSCRTRALSCSRVIRTIPSEESMRTSGVPGARPDRLRTSAGTTSRPRSPITILNVPLIVQLYQFDGTGGISLRGWHRP